jgi:8-oxo-dGTP pyrophosphatase MutT (NUDIX family)
VETLRSDRLYASPWLSVREDEVLRTDGSTGIYRVVESSDICLVIPTDGDRLHLVEQYRHPVGGRRWEFPSGSTEPPSDVDPEAVAARELREETGLVAARLTLLGTIEISPSTLDQRCRVFLATDLSQGPPQRELAEQVMLSAWFTRAEVERMIVDGAVTDAKSIAAYTLLQLERATTAS